VYEVLRNADRNLTSKLFEVFPGIDITLHVREESVGTNVVLVPVGVYCKIEFSPQENPSILQLCA